MLRICRPDLSSSNTAEPFGMVETKRTARPRKPAMSPFSSFDDRARDCRFSVASCSSRSTVTAMLCTTSSSWLPSRTRAVR